MGRKGLVSIFSRLAVDSAPAAGPATPPWPWPPCGTNPRTASFRVGGGGELPCCATTTAAGASRGGPAATGNNKLMARWAAPGEMYKTVNSVYLDDPAADVDFFSLAGDEEEEEEEGELLLDDVDSFSTTTASEEWSEAVIRSLGRTPTERFFFDPGLLPASNSILATAAPSPARKTLPAAEAKTKTVTPPDSEPDDDAEAQQPCAPSKSLAEGSVAVAVDSGDPYGDFRASMEEMVSAHGLRDWAALEELLAWYLRINGKQHHHLIVDAFVDLLLGLASSDTAAETSTSSSSSSGSASAGSRCTTSTSTSTAATTTSAGGDAAIVAATAVTTAAAAAAQCGGGNEAAACCSSSSSSCAAGPDIQDQDDVDEEDEKASSAAAAGADRAGAAASAPLRVPQSIT